MNLGFAAKAGAVVAIIGLAVAFVDREKRRAAAEERYRVVAEKYVTDSLAHEKSVAMFREQQREDSIKVAEANARADASEERTRVAINRAAEADRRAEDAWEEAEEELDPEDYRDLREAFDAQDEALDECSLALKDCGTLTLALEEANETLRDDLAERDEFEATSAATIQSLRLELADANKVDWLPWGIAAGASALLLAVIIAG